VFRYINNKYKSAMLINVAYSADERSGLIGPAAPTRGLGSLADGPAHEPSFLPDTIANERPALIAPGDIPERTWMRVAVPADQAFVRLVVGELAEARRRALELLEVDAFDVGERGHE